MASNKKYYSIYRFSFNKLLEYGKINKEKKVLVVNELCSEDAMDSKGNCQLFDQTIKALKIDDNDLAFKKIYINIDFSPYIYAGYSLAKKLKEIENGIQLFIDGELIQFLDFYKSNSMSKKSCVYYVNKEYKDIIDSRITFNLNKEELILSKWQAYSGLSISDATILEGFKLSEEEMIIIPDSEVTTNVECITAISVPLLTTILSSLEKSIKDKSNKVTYYKSKLNAFLNSKDLIRIQEEKETNKRIIFNRKHLINILNTYNSYKDKENNELLIIINKILKDYENFAELEKEDAISNKYSHSSKEVYWEKFHVANYPVTVNKFDGQGLVDINYAKEINDYLGDEIANYDNEEAIDNLISLIFNNTDDKAKKGYSYQIRLPFIKGMIHACDFKSFFKEKDISVIYGKTYDEQNPLKAYDINKVKIILTESQFKAYRVIKCIERNEDETPISAFFRMMNECDYELAISNLVPKDDTIINLNYQFISTIPFDEKELDELITINRDLYKEETSDSSLANKISKGNSIENDILLANEEFYCSSSTFLKQKEKNIKSLSKELLKIRIDCPGCRKILCADLLDLLYFSAFHNKNLNYDLPILNLTNFYAPNTEISHKRECVLLRNPHYSRNEIAVLKPMNECENNERIKYFSHLSGILMVNPMSLTAERLGGADYDGDTIALITTPNLEKTIDNLITKDNQMKYPVIIIPSIQSNKVLYTYENVIKCFENTFSSRVGLISNNAFYKSFNSYNKGNIDIKEEIPIYTILSGLEIDSAKKGVKPYLLSREENHLAKLFKDSNSYLSSLSPKLDLYKERLIKNKDNHILFKISNHIYNFINPYKYEESTKSASLINKTVEINNDILMALAIKYVYDNFKLTVREMNSFTFSKKNKNLINSTIEDNINYILYKKGFNDKSELLSALYTNDPTLTLSNYCKSKNKFHYLLNEDERKDYIINYLKIDDIPTDYLDLLCDFSNDGCYLLYLIILYNKTLHSVNLYENNFNEQLNKFINNTRIYKNSFGFELSNKDLRILKIHIKEIKEEFKDEIEAINHLTHRKYIDSITKKLYAILKDKSHQLDYKSCLSIIYNLLNDSIVFDIFGDHILKALINDEVKFNG